MASVKLDSRTENYHKNSVDPRKVHGFVELIKRHS